MSQRRADRMPSDFQRRQTRPLDQPQYRFAAAQQSPGRCTPECKTLIELPALSIPEKGSARQSGMKLPTSLRLAYYLFPFNFKLKFNFKNSRWTRMTPLPNSLRPPARHQFPVAPSNREYYPA